ncbi:MAG: hypothetical protein INF44_05185 [Thalassospira sp.]|jgi:hypothetical protein|nr:hypothetical protein [Thalassospira sp.]
MVFFSENYVREDSAQGFICITGDSIQLQKEMIDPEKDLIIRADSVYLKESIYMLGRKIHLFARLLKCTDGITIDVSGKNGLVDFTGMGRARDGQLPGEAGTNGRPGDNGQNGGEIILIGHSISGNVRLLANGGHGGKAEDGGWGNKGDRGRNGSRPASSLANANAESGHKGGNAGKAGVPGKGGNGGLISINFYIPIQKDSIVAEAKGGNPGENGVPGRAGQGGDPGLPGYYTERVCD